MVLAGLCSTGRHFPVKSRFSRRFTVFPPVYRRFRRFTVFSPFYYFSAVLPFSAILLLFPPFYYFPPFYPCFRETGSEQFKTGLKLDLECPWAKCHFYYRIFLQLFCLSFVTV